ncbi:hypothetical protein GUJ93_ZPchr0004g40512 [Zizania palustris]|uniref:Reverse transcriptase domain-containing protein n=1 Tax=Zizania palustris TaxID=103762 RepID=A0A8J5SEX8_ZIZPA|nr:hypothetical protein GUJ93_ZPchr0004g40512 [Zizania palustris]
MDDIVIKSIVKQQHSLDLDKTFESLRACGVRLNPKKCIFGMQAGKLLGYSVLSKVIEASPTQISALQRMAPLENLKQVQKLTGRLTALSRFLAISAEQSLRIFKALKGSESIKWMPEC